MASKSVAVLNSAGRKLRYTTYKLAESDVVAGIAVRESERCIRLLPNSEGGEWRPRRSGRYGPIVPQMERLLTAVESKEHQ